MQCPRFVRIGLTFLALTSVVSAANQPATMDVFNALPLLRINPKDGDDRRRAWDQLHLLAALQGLANRDQPRLYVLLVGADGRIDRYWLDRLQRRGEWLADCTWREQTNLLALVRQYRHFAKGVVVWDERVPATALVASTAAGVENLLPVRYDTRPGSLYHQLVIAANGPRLAVKRRLLQPDGSPLFTGARSGSAKCDAMLWAIDHYLKPRRCHPSHLGYYPDAWWLAGRTAVAPLNTLLCNHDYFIAQGAFFFDLGPWDDETPIDDPKQPLGTDARTLRALLNCAWQNARGRMIHVGGFTPWDQKYTDYTGGKHGGVPTEWRYAEILSCFNAYMDADAPGLHAMANASVFQHYPLAKTYPQMNLPARAQLQTRGYVDASGQVAPKNYLAIYAGDYDSAAWLYQQMPDMWDDPARGQVPVGWAFNPSLAQRFPVGLAYARATATSNDTFVAGDSGFGYLNPGALVPPRRWSGLPAGLSAWESLCREGYRRWDLRITGFVIDGDAQPMNAAVKAAYARFSPDGVVAQKIPPAALVNGVPFLRMGSDLPDPDQGKALVLATFPPGRPGPNFGIFRTILWTPASHKRLFDALREVRPDIEVVEPHTLFELLREHLINQQLIPVNGGANR